MNKEIYTKNMQALRQKYPAWAATVESVKRKKRGFDVIAENSLSGTTILKVNNRHKVLYLNGKYAPEAGIEDKIAQLGKIEDYAPIIIVGMSNALHIKRIMQLKPKTSNVLIYEPSCELFRRELEEVDLSFLFEKDIPVGIIVDGLNESEIEAYLRLFISYDNMVSLKMYISGNYPILFSKEIEEFIKKIKSRIFELQVSWNTQVRYTDINAKNLFSNLPYLCEGYGVQAIRSILPEDFPVIIVSAGPSLNKNIKDLKKAVGKACIIATDTAVKPLLSEGIVPDLFVIVDGLKPALLFDDKNISKSAMVTMTGVSVEPMQMHKGRKFFYYSGGAYENELLEELSRKENSDCTLPNLPTGGSVANTAYSLGIYMGSRIIILIGQDLALTGNKTHADGTFAEKMSEIDVNNPKYFEVESVEGGKVLTRADFKLYLDWFEKYIKEWNWITTIDATEGGALIHGSHIMTLKKAIKKYCKKEFNVKWHINHVKKLFDEENVNIALNYFKDAEHKIDEVEKKAKEGLKYYEKLNTANQKTNTSSKELLKLTKKIKKLNHYMESDYMAETVIESLKGMEYTLRPLIYQTEENQKDEIDSVTEQGRAMMYGIAVAAEEIKKIAEDTIVSYAKKCND